jgi:translation initiation factor SUI1
MDMEMNFKAEDDLIESGNMNVVHIRVQHRAGRKHITTIAGIDNEFDFEKLLKYWKKTLNCNGSLVEEKE